MIKRRQLLAASGLCGIYSLAPWRLEAADSLLANHSDAAAYTKLVENLLETWCEGMIKHQIVDEADPSRHGALWCPACQKIHGRCMDAVYPFMHMAHKSGDKKYLNAAILSMEWSKNVSKEDGSWTVIPDPNSWAGITVFGAIALAEALKYHSQILPADIDKQWRTRLAHAAQYVYQNFDLEFTNINYGATAIYAFLLIGEVLGDDKLTRRSHELAKGIKAFFTQPNAFLFGEGKPSRAKSAKGLLPVDLGYNVEESLNALVIYALHENDGELLSLLEKSLSTHLEFMLPDGAWDNSWGTRQAKWSYWGSRTTDGSQPAYSAMAHINPVFGKAAFANTELLANCTEGGLLHGGPHYVSHGVLPCIHHTFAHAKPLAYLLDHPELPARVSKLHSLPREKEYGVKHFPELDVWLVALGGWRATISAYDALYKEKNQDIQQATGGAISMLWHEAIGPLMAASMPEYYLVEKNNQQPQPNGEDIALTPRLEAYDKDGNWFTNLYDLSAEVEADSMPAEVVLNVKTELKDRQGQALGASSKGYELEYAFGDSEVKIVARRKQSPIKSERFSRLTIPLVCRADEELRQLTRNKIALIKKGGVVLVESDQAIELRETEKLRVFNMVPGMEAIVLDLYMPAEPDGVVKCSVTVSSTV